MKCQSCKGENSKHKCWVCEKENEEHICEECGNKGWWIDPAGGLHDPEEEDPAKQYE